MIINMIYLRRNVIRLSRSLKLLPFPSSTLDSPLTSFHHFIVLQCWASSSTSLVYSHRDSREQEISLLFFFQCLLLCFTEIFDKRRLPIFGRMDGRLGRQRSIKWIKVAMLQRELAFLMSWQKSTLLCCHNQAFLADNFTWSSSANDDGKTEFNRIKLARLRSFLSGAHTTTQLRIVSLSPKCHGMKIFWWERKIFNYIVPLPPLFPFASAKSSYSTLSPPLDFPPANARKGAISSLQPNQATRETRKVSKTNQHFFALITFTRRQVLACICCVMPSTEIKRIKLPLLILVSFTLYALSASILRKKVN